MTTPPPDPVVFEFTVEPFTPAAPGPHVIASIEAARATGLSVEVGPFGTTVTGNRQDMAELTGAVVRAALENGASQVSLQVRTDGHDREQGHQE